MSRPVSRGGRSPGPTPPGARLTRAPHPCPPPAVGYPSDVESVILGPDGVLANLKEGGAIVDMTTSKPSLAVEIAEKAAAKGIHSVDAPVTGGDLGAKAGTLSIMCGGSAEGIALVTPLLQLMGTPRTMAGPGSGQHCKMANQIGIANTMLGMVEGMLYAHKAGLNVPEYLDAIRGGGAGSKSIDLYSGRILSNDMEPGFFVKHFVKDLGIALDESRAMGLALPGLAVAQQLYISLIGHGEENLGTQALIKALERINNVEVPKGS